MRKGCKLKGAWQRVWGTLLVVLVLGMASCQNPDRVDVQAPEPQVEPPAPVERFGIRIDDYAIDTLALPSNMVLSSLLLERGVKGPQLAQLDGAMRDVFPARKLRAGQPSYFFSRPDDGAVAFWVYQHSPTVYLKLDFRGDTLGVSLDTLQTERRIHSMHAVIESSLWNAMRKAGTRVEVPLALSDLFAWTVDFFGLAQGDQFYAVYEQVVLDSTVIGLGTIEAARYIHGKDTISAYRYEQNGQWGYWDASGRSLRKAFLKAPLRFSRISSHFSYARKHPILKIVRPHTGVDYAAPAGTPVVALGDGTVIEKGYQHGGGNFVKIKHNSVYTTAYLHLQGFGKGIAKGVRVSQGQVIGYVGSTGLATGPHLDFRVWKSGKPVDPLQLESPSVEPIDSSARIDFARRVAHLDSMLAMAR